MQFLNENWFALGFILCLIKISRTLTGMYKLQLRREKKQNEPVNLLWAKPPEL